MLTLGSAGDVHPFIGVGLALKARGHDVRIGTNPHFKARIRAAGLGFYRWEQSRITTRSSTIRGLCGSLQARS
jgi:rhamnosyltransferase subunit B